VTAGAILVGCFNVDNLAQHRIEPYEHYHWNTLSSRSFVESFERHGFNAQVIHIGAFLRESVGCEETHNPNAVTFEFRREAG